MHTGPSPLYAYGCFKTENVVLEVRLVLLNWGIINGGQSPSGWRTRCPVISTVVHDFFASDVGQVTSQARVILQVPEQTISELGQALSLVLRYRRHSIIHTTE
jgi:hypothetical protein